MLLDEPAAGLINSEIDELDSIIRHFAREMNVGVMLVEHRLELLSAIADRVVVLDLGKLIAEGDPDTVFEEPARAGGLFRGGSGMTDVLRIEDLSAGYGPLGVLHNVNLTVRAGERIGIIGLNGHGKSTLLKAIVGLTGWQSGSIKLNGVEIGGTRSQGPGRYTHKIVRMGLALMPQGDALFHGLTVADHLDSGAFTPRAWRERKQRRERVLAIFPPLEKLLGQPVGKLSGGERRMVSIGRGLMDDAKLLLIDEPSLGLAPKISKGLVEALMRIDIKDGAMVIAEQNLSLLEGKVSRLIGLHAGKLKGGAVTPDVPLSEFAHHHAH